VADPTAGPWPGSGSSFAQIAQPDLASNWSPDRCAPLIDTLVKTVSVTGFCGCPPT
jgi:hypothetical protein